MYLQNRSCELLDWHNSKGIPLAIKFDGKWETIAGIIDYTETTATMAMTCPDGYYELDVPMTTRIMYEPAE